MAGRFSSSDKEMKRLRKSYKNLRESMIYMVDREPSNYRRGFSLVWFLIGLRVRIILMLPVNSQND
jgi:hypothetical protein